VRQGATLVLVINALVPLDNDPEHGALPQLSTGKFSSIAELGISFVGDQAMRMSSKDRLDMAIAMCGREHPEVELVLFEPRRMETLLFLQNPMSFEARRHIMTYGFHAVLQEIEARFDDYAALFARHSVTLTRARLAAVLAEPALA